MSEKIEARKLREKEFHNERFSSFDISRKPVEKYYSIWANIRTYFQSLILVYASNKTLLEYGCGTGDSAIKWSKKGINVTGIDISETGILEAKKKSKNENISVHFLVMDAENLIFNDQSFDVIIGSGILHHLHIKKAFFQISRVLKENGHAVFVEPLGHNAAINLYRRLTPKMRTVDEHPLLFSDLNLANDFFSSVRKRYFGLTSFMAVPFFKTPFFIPILNFFDKLDEVILFLLPFLKKYAWIVVLDLSSPKTKL